MAYRKRTTTRRKTTTTPARRTYRRRGVSSNFSTKLKKATTPILEGAAGGALAGIADKYLGENLLGITGGTAALGALVTAVMLPKRTHVSAGMAAVAAQKMLANSGLAENGNFMTSGVTQLTPAQANELLTTGGANLQSDFYNSLSEGAYTYGWGADRV